MPGARSSSRNGVRVTAMTLARGIFSAALLVAIAAPGPATEARQPPIQIERQGAFEAGGTVIGAAGQSLSCDHGHVEFQIPVRARTLPLFFWHSSTAAVWQRRWDGGEGFQSIFLRRGFATYIWDGPRVGRANFGCTSYTYSPEPGQDQKSFRAWRFGESYPHWFPGVQFPTGDAEAWNQAVRERYDEFDTVANAELESDAAAKALDRIGRTVLITNSAGGLRALLTALKTDKVGGIVAYENPGFVFPESENTGSQPGPYGPVYVSDAEFAKLTRIPIQLVWGDNIEKFPGWAKAYRLAETFARIANARGGHVEILRLTDRGLHGNTHLPFMDLNNVAVANLLSEFLQRHALDHRSGRRTSPGNAK